MVLQDESERSNKDQSVFNSKIVFASNFDDPQTLALNADFDSVSINPPHGSRGGPSNAMSRMRIKLQSHREASSVQPSSSQFAAKSHKIQDEMKLYENKMD